uniref:Uncharacterized protein n=1 Tax=Mycolicibacterium phage phi1_186018 TaxID=3236641 RepID=A0AB39AKV3_9CAUD
MRLSWLWAQRATPAHLGKMGGRCFVRGIPGMEFSVAQWPRTSW